MPTLVADGAADSQLPRSVSAREVPARGIHGNPEKRRSTSFDETHGELARAYAAACTQLSDTSISKKKLNFWQSRVWKFTKGKRAAKENVAALSQKQEDSDPTWKKLLHKLTSKARNARKPAICSSNLDLQVADSDRSVFMRGDGRSKSVCNQAEKQQRLYSVFPEPTLVSPRPTTNSIWERRSVACPPKLDLNNLRVTGLRHVSRPPPHQRLR